MTCNHTEHLARLDRRIDSLQSDLAKERTARKDLFAYMDACADWGNLPRPGDFTAPEPEYGPLTVVRGGRSA